MKLLPYYYNFHFKSSALSFSQHHNHLQYLPPQAQPHVNRSPPSINVGTQRYCIIICGSVCIRRGWRIISIRGGREFVKSARRSRELNYHIVPPSSNKNKDLRVSVIVWIAQGASLFEIYQHYIKRPYHIRIRTLQSSLPTSKTNCKEKYCKEKVSIIFQILHHCGDSSSYIAHTIISV